MYPKTHLSKNPNLFFKPTIDSIFKDQKDLKLMKLVEVIILDGTQACLDFINQENDLLQTIIILENLYQLTHKRSDIQDRIVYAVMRSLEKKLNQIQSEIFDPNTPNTQENFIDIFNRLLDLQDSWDERKNQIEIRRGDEAAERKAFESILDKNYFC